MPLGAFRQSLNLANPVAGQEILSFTNVNSLYSTGPTYVAAQGSSPRAVYFSDDGTILYSSSSGDDIIYQYTLSTPWDLSTVSYANKSFSHATQDANSGEGLAINDTGTTLMLLIRTSAASTVYQYTLSTAWDISTASYANKNFSIALEGRGLAFKPDGDKMWIAADSDRVYQYTLSTPWDISTASYANKAVTVSTSGQIEGITASKLGNSIITADTENSNLRSFTMATPWEITLSPTQTASVNHLSLPTTLRDVYMSPTNKYLFGINSVERVHKFVNSSYGTYITRNTNSTSTTIGTGSAPQSAANDYAFLFDYSTSTTEVVPSGWTKISSIAQTGIRTTISYKKLVSGDVNATITGQATTTNKTIIICRPTVDSNITVSSVNAQSTTLTPTNQTLSISNETGTIVGFFVSASTGATTRTFTPVETFSGGAGGLAIRTVMYQGGETPLNHTISMTDGGSNTLQSFWVKFTPV